jgi:hypothetical protein
VAGVEVVALAEVDGGSAGATVEEAVGDVDEPGADAEDGEGAGGDFGAYGAGESPCPEDGDCGRIEAEEMPVDGESGEKGAPLFLGTLLAATILASSGE